MLERIKRNLKQYLLLLIAVGILIRSADCLLPLGRFIANINRSMRHSILDDYENDYAFTKEAGRSSAGDFFRSLIKALNIDLKNADKGAAKSFKAVQRALDKARHLNTENFKFEEEILKATTDNELKALAARIYSKPFKDVTDGDLRAMKDVQSVIFAKHIASGKIVTPEAAAAEAAIKKYIKQHQTNKGGAPAEPTFKEPTLNTDVSVEGLRANTLAQEAAFEDAVEVLNQRYGTDYTVDDVVWGGRTSGSPWSDFDLWSDGPQNEPQIQAAKRFIADMLNRQEHDSLGFTQMKLDQGVTPVKGPGEFPTYTPDTAEQKLIDSLWRANMAIGADNQARRLTYSPGDPEYYSHPFLTIQDTIDTVRKRKKLPQEVQDRFDTYIDPENVRQVAKQNGRNKWKWSNFFTRPLEAFADNNPVYPPNYYMYGPLYRPIDAVLNQLKHTNASDGYKAMLNEDLFDAMTPDEMLDWLKATPTRLSTDEARVFRNKFEDKLSNSSLTPDEITEYSNTAMAELVKNVTKETTEIDPKTWGMWLRKGWNRNKTRNLQEAIADIDTKSEAQRAALADFDAQRKSLMGQVVPFNREGKPAARGEYVGFKDSDILQNGIIKLDGEDGKPIFNYDKAELNMPDNPKVDAEGNLLPDNRYGVGIKARKVYDTSSPLETMSYEWLKRADLDTLLEFLRNPFKTAVDDAIENEFSLAELLVKMRRGERLTPDELTTYRSIVKGLPPDKVHSIWRDIRNSIMGIATTGSKVRQRAAGTGNKARQAAAKAKGGWNATKNFIGNAYDKLFIAPTRNLRAFRDAMKDNWLVQAGLFGVDPFGAIYRSQSGLGFGARVLGDLGAGGLAYTFTGLPIFGGFMAAGADQLGKGMQRLGEQDDNDWWITRLFKAPTRWIGTGIRWAHWPFISSGSPYFNWFGYGSEAEAARAYIDRQSWSAEEKEALKDVADRSEWLLSSLPPSAREATIKNMYDKYTQNPKEFLVAYHHVPEESKGFMPWSASWFDLGGEVTNDGPVEPFVNRMSEEGQKKAEEVAALPENANNTMKAVTGAADNFTAKTNELDEKINGNGENSPLAFLSNMNKNTQTWRNSMANWSAPIGLGPSSPYGATAGGALGGLLVGGAIGALRYALQDPEKMSELERKRRSLLKMMAQYGMYGATAAGAVGGAFDLAAYANNQNTTAPADKASVPAAATAAYSAPMPSSPFTPNSNPWDRPSYPMA